MRHGAAKASEVVLPAEVASRILREQFFYRVEEAGACIGLTRTGSYAAVQQGIIPAERYGKFLLVRRVVWNRELKKIRRRLRAAPAKKRRPKTVRILAKTPAIAEAEEAAA